MDLRVAVKAIAVNDEAVIELSGWLVDCEGGLFILDDHSPEDYDFSCRVRVKNKNIIYVIFQQVPILGGGKTLLFYKARVQGLFVNSAQPEVLIRSIAVQYDQNSHIFHHIDFDDEMIDKFVEKFGDYKFNPRREPMGDWLDEYDD